MHSSPHLGTMSHIACPACAAPALCCGQRGRLDEAPECLGARGPTSAGESQPGRGQRREHEAGRQEDRTQRECRTAEKKRLSCNRMASANTTSISATSAQSSPIPLPGGQDRDEATAVAAAHAMLQSCCHRQEANTNATRDTQLLRCARQNTWRARGLRKVALCCFQATMFWQAWRVPVA